MSSYSYKQGSENYEHNFWKGIPVKPNQEGLFADFLARQDLSPSSTEAIVYDLRKFAQWFTSANREPWDVERVTIRDIIDFREYLRLEKKLAASTINRNLVSIRKYFKWLSKNGHTTSNPAIDVKQLRKQPLAPQGLSRSEVRKILREVELRNDVRANCLFTFILYTGARLSDVVNIEISDLMISERSGTAIFRYGKGSKQRVVPLPLQARKALTAYLEVRPPVETQKVYIGERGQLGKRGVQAVFEKYRVLTGITNLHCHVMRHTFAHRFLSSSQDGGAGGDLVQLASLLGHESLTTTAIYTKNSVEQLAESTERLSY